MGWGWLGFCHFVSVLEGNRSIEVWLVDPTNCWCYERLEMFFFLDIRVLQTNKQIIKPSEGFDTWYLFIRRLSLPWDMYCSWVVCRFVFLYKVCSLFYFYWTYKCTFSFLSGFTKFNVMNYLVFWWKDLCKTFLWHFFLLFPFSLLVSVLHI